MLENVRDADEGPMLVHVVTKKGKGYAPAENAADKYHGVVKFDVVSGEQAKAAAGAPSYTSVFAKALIGEMARDEKVVAITAAMPSGTGLDKFAEKFPDRTFDVGIAEQHAVTFAAGLAAQGYRPFCAIYSTFLQRAYDQVVHDVAIQNLPVRFAMDRAGLVGADGATHAGSFDLAYLCTLAELRGDGGGRRGRAGPHGPHHGAARQRPDRGALSARRGQRACRFPTVPQAARDRQGPHRPRRAARSRSSRSAPGSPRRRRPPTSSRRRACRPPSPTCASPSRSTSELIRKLLTTHEVAVTIEEASIGGLGAHVLTLASDEGLIDAGLKIRTMRLPDRSRTMTSPRSSMTRRASTRRRSSRRC